MNFKKDKLRDLASDILGKAEKRKGNTATLITLKGELGAGKTALTQEVAKILGVKESLVSPTFVIMKRYQTRDPRWKTLIHIDAYRIDKSSELVTLGWGALYGDPDNLIIMEWPEQVPECVGDAHIRVCLEHPPAGGDEETRSIDILV
jgi:tRNA threonylcarbamoyladenosine biosynthesis protein TsaE